MLPVVFQKMWVKGHQSYLLFSFRSYLQNTSFIYFEKLEKKKNNQKVIHQNNENTTQNFYNQKNINSVLK